MSMSRENESDVKTACQEYSPTGSLESRVREKFQPLQSSHGNGAEQNTESLFPSVAALADAGLVTCVLDYNRFVPI